MITKENQGSLLISNKDVKQILSSQVSLEQSSPRLESHNSKSALRNLPPPLNVGATGMRATGSFLKQTSGG
jgi:hypothetical protein